MQKLMRLPDSEQIDFFTRGALDLQESFWCFLFCILLHRICNKANTHAVLFIWPPYINTPSGAYTAKLTVRACSLALCLYLDMSKFKPAMCKIDKDKFTEKETLKAGNNSSNQGLSLNRLQCGSCSTEYNTLTSLGIIPFMIICTIGSEHIIIQPQ